MFRDRHAGVLVSVVIPARNWDEHLVSTLVSIRGQELPGDVEVETIIGLAGEAPPELPDDVAVVANPSGTIPDALNGAIAEATGEVVVRVDARCNLPSEYVARVVERLADPSIGCVGGAALVLDRGRFGSTYAVAFNSPLIGPSAYRYRRSSGPVDTAYLGAWRASELRALGGYDPRLVRNQDNELADRVRSSGRIVLYDSDLVVGYVNGRGLRATLSHHHEFGLWRMYQSSEGQKGLSAKHVLALTVGLLGSAVGATALFRPSTRGVALAGAVAGYVAAAAGAWRTATRLRRVRADIDLNPLDPIGVAMGPALAAAIDVAWVAGIVRGVIAARGSTRDGEPITSRVH